MDTAEIIKAAEKLAMEHMATYNDVSHDWFHVDRVRRLSLQIAQKSWPEKKLNLFAIEVGALFHDICDHKYMPAGINHEEYLLTKFFCHHPSIDLESLNLINFIAGGVSWTKEQKRLCLPTSEVDDMYFTCLELHCVQDADKLDSMGSIGIMRCAAYSQQAHQQLLRRQGCETAEPSAQQHFYDKLLSVNDRLVTPWGIHLGEARYQIMQQFITQLEIEGQR